MPSRHVIRMSLILILTILNVKVHLRTRHIKSIKIFMMQITVWEQLILDLWQVFYWSVILLLSFDSLIMLSAIFFRFDVVSAIYSVYEIKMEEMWFKSIYSRDKERRTH